MANNIINKGKAAVAAVADKLSDLEVQYVPIESVKPNSYNPNRQSDRDFDLLCMSMQADGFTQPIIVNSSTREIVDGEHRWRAGRKLGLTEVPVVLMDMTKDQMRLSTLRHNRARGSEDVEQAIQVLRDLEAVGALELAQTELGLSDLDIDRLLSDVPVPERLAGAEFGGAWVPTRGDANEGTVGGTRAVNVSMTSAAQGIQDATQASVGKASTDEERQQIAKATSKSIFRVACTFDKEDAVLVRSVLGDKPAQKLLQLCLAKESASV